ncbi:MAG: hypothetical protein ACK56I_36485, partial [bacterium]
PRRSGRALSESPPPPRSRRSGYRARDRLHPSAKARRSGAGRSRPVAQRGLDRRGDAEEMLVRHRLACQHQPHRRLAGAMDGQADRAAVEDIADRRVAQQQHVDAVVLALGLHRRDRRRYQR